MNDDAGGANPYQPPVADLTVATRMQIEPFTSVGRLFGRAFSLYLGSFATIAIVTLVVFAPVEFIKNYLLYATNSQDDFGTAARVDMALEGFLGALITPALLHALLYRMETGRECGIRESLAAGMNRWTHVFAARFVSGLWVLLGMMLFVVPGLYWMMRYSLTDEVASLDASSSAQDVMKRSDELTRGYGWKILGVALLGSIFVLSVQFVAGIMLGFIDHWVVSAVVGSAADVAYRFYVPLLLLVYLGVGGRIAADPGMEALAEGTLA